MIRKVNTTIRGQPVRAVDPCLSTCLRQHERSERNLTVSSVKRLLLGVLVCGLTCGCGKTRVEKPTPINNLVPTVKVERPALRDIHQSIAQPGAIEPYEQTPIYSKI